MSNEMVTIARFNFPSDPDFLMFLHELEDANIPYSCPERHQLEVMPLHSIGLGGLRVMVPLRHEERALDIYEAFKNQTAEEPDEADRELARLKAEDEKRANRTFQSCLVAVAVLCLACYLILQFKGK